MAVDGALEIPIIFDTSGLKQGLNEATKETEATFKELANKLETLNKKNIFKLDTKELTKEADNIHKRIAELSKAKNEIKLQPQTKDTEKALDIINNRIKDLNKSSKLLIEIKEAKTSKLSDIDKKIKELTKERDLKISSAKSTKQVKKGTEAIDKELDHLTKVREIKVDIDSKNIDNAKQSLSALGNIAKVSAVAIGGIATSLGLAVKQAIDFQSQFGEVETLLSGVPTEKVDELKQGVIDLSRETGILTSESIPAMYQALSASVPADNVVSFLQTASKTAIGGVTDLSTSVDGLTNILNAYAMDTSEVTNVSDLLFETMKRGKTTIGELASSYFNVIPTAASVGVKFSDISAAMATITAQGTPTSVATTQLRQALVELSSEGSKASKTFKELSGKTFKDFIASGGNLQKALQLMEKEAQKNNTTINNLFSSVEAGNAVLGLTGANTQRFTNDLEAMANATGATTEAFAKIDETPAQRIRKLVANFQALTLELGNNLLPTAEKIFSAFEKGLPTIQKLGTFLGNVVSVLVANGKLVVSVVAGLATAFVGLNVALAITNPSLIGTSGAIGMVTAAFGALNIATGGIIIAIGFVASALVLLLTHLDSVINGFEKFAAALGNNDAKLKQTVKSVKELSDSYKQNAGEMEAGRKEADKLIATYNQLSQKQNRTAEENEKLKQSLEAIRKTFPTLADEIEKNGGKLEGIGLGHFLTVDERELSKQANDTIKKADEALKLAQKNKKDLKAQESTWIGSDADYKRQIDEVTKAEEEALKQLNEARTLRNELDNRALQRQQGMVSELENQVDVQSDINKLLDNYNKASKGKEKKDPLKELEASYKARKEIINQTIDDEEKKNEALIQNDIEYYTKRLELQKANAEAILKSGEAEKKARQKDLESIYADIEETQSKLDALNSTEAKPTFFEQLKASWQELASGVAGLFDSITNYFTSSLDNQLDKLEENLDLQLKAIEDKLEYETELYEKQLEDLEKREEERQEIIEKSEEKIAELNAEIGEHATEEQYLQYQKQLEDYQNRIDEQKALMEQEEAEKLLLEEQQKLREEEAQQRKIELEKQFAIEKAKIERKQAEANKANGIFNAIVSTAQGVASVLGLGLVGIALASIIGAMGAVQIATIASTPLPQIPTYSKGGIVGEPNNKLYEKLVGKSGNSEDKTLIWASQGEMVLTREQAEAYRQGIANNNINNSRVVNNNPNVNMNFTFNSNKGLNEKQIMSTIKKEVPNLVVNAITRGY